MTETVPVTLKWGKKTFSLTLTTGETASSFKQRVQEQTGVPLARQKLLAKKGWKGPLKDDTILELNMPLTVTLIGSTETLKEPAVKPKFLEDLTPEDLRRQEQTELQAAIKTATGWIPALQLPPHHRDDGKQEWYQYNRLVTGLPQRQIEQELKKQQQHSDITELQGTAALNLGLELRRAYVNDLAVLEDGTCVSVLDDGHVQLWKEAAQQEDVVHPGQEGPVNSVVALPGAFATAGRGTIQLWNSDAEPIVALFGVTPGTTPSSLTKVNIDNNNTTCLAARFQITRQTNPQQFRLPPQDAAERERRAQAEAQEEAIQQTLAKAARSLQVWFGNTTQLQSQILEPTSSDAAPITSLANMSLADGTQVLIAGDMAGGLRLWKVHRQENGGLSFVHSGLYQFRGASVVCLEALQNHRLAVSTDASNQPQELTGAIPIPTTITRAVHILDFSIDGPPTLQASLTGHADKDAVICMRQLPNGDLLTGGGKLDATLQLWTKSQLEANDKMQEDDAEPSVVVPKSHKILTDVGYVFAIELLPDVKVGSNHFAVAVARYNTVKIVI